MGKGWLGAPFKALAQSVKTRRASVGSPGKATDGGPGANPADALTFLFCFVFFNAETEFQCKLTCSLDDDHVHLKTMMRPRGYSIMIGYGRAADT